jgi:hypothetical protein
MQKMGNNGHTWQLKPEQQTALDVLLNGGSPQDAAKAAGVAQSTIYRWQKNRAFLAALQTEDSATLADRLEKLNTALVQGAQFLLDVIADPTVAPGIKLRAVQIAGQQWEAAFKIAEISERMDSLEERLERQGL